jgi:two-component system, chemotaxis family, protein-glutamate methylesterase/glutaminase
VRVVRTAVRSKLQQEIAASAPRIEPAPAPPRSAAAAAAAAAVPATSPAPALVSRNGKFPVVVIASSTGGPATLMKFVPMFPKDFPGAVILVQHMPGTFTSQFAQQLGEIAQIRIKDAEQGEILQPATFYVCPGSHHLRVTPTGRITLDDGPRIAGYRPCADISLETAAAFAGPMTIGVVLTGMGNDGSQGIQKVKTAGGHVIAQDESTSVIFGMNAEAIKTGCVDQVLPLENIFSAVEKRVLYVFGAARVGAL